MNGSDAGKPRICKWMPDQIARNGSVEVLVCPGLIRRHGDLGFG